MFICAISGRLLRTQYPCSSVQSVGDSLCCLRFILPHIPQIFTDFIYPRIRVHPRYLWEIPSHPISVLIRAICGRFLCCLRFILPHIPQIITDFIYPRIRVHPRYLWEIFPHPDTCLLVKKLSSCQKESCLPVSKKLLFLHRQRDAASALIHFRHSHHHVLV